MIAPTSLYSAEDLLPALREAFSHHPGAVRLSPEKLAQLLPELCFVREPIEVFAVEAALQALAVEDEVLG